MNTEIVPNMTLRDAVGVYRQARLSIEEAFAQVVRAEQQLTIFGEHINVSSANCGRNQDFEHPDAALAYIERRVWVNIVDRMGVRGAMSIVDREKLDRQLREGEMPPLDEESILSLMQGMAAQLPSLAEAAIREVWEWLRPPEWSYAAKAYKSNPRFELGDVVKIADVFEEWSKRIGRWSVGNRAAMRLDALERVFRVLDGKGAAQRGHRSDLVLALMGAPYESGAQARTEYFSCKLFLKGSVHIKFQRSDLAAEFNRVCGGLELRGERVAGGG